MAFNEVTKKMDKFDKINTELLQSALSKLEASRTTEYYNTAEDEQNRDQYYQGIDFQSSPQDLFKALSEIVRNTHKKKLAYQPSEHLYPDVDLQPDMTIRSIYSEKEYSPEEFIYEDLRIDQERGRRMRETISSGDDYGGHFFSQLLNSLEDDLPYNCEHVVPQSWFGKRQPMKGDLHHLFACEEKCNQFRDNIPYFDFTGIEGTVKTDCGHKKAGGFEPSGGKGAVSRAVLYFLLRYTGEINSVSSEYTKAGIKILLAWHRDFEPEIYEKHRNAVIFKKQGNRNPFIDLPPLAEKVDFSLGLG